jgi:hypothetical protein
VAFFRALPSRAFERGVEEFRHFGLECIDRLWSPGWPPDEIPDQFLEQWRRLLVRIRLAAVMGDEKFPIEDDLVTRTAQGIAQLASQSAAVGRDAMDGWLRRDVRLQACTSIVVPEASPPSPQPIGDEESASPS